MRAWRGVRASRRWLDSCPDPTAPTPGLEERTWARWRSPRKQARPSALLRSRKLDARRGLQPAPGHRPEAHCLAERKQGRRVGFAADEWRRRAGQRCIQGDGRKLAAQQCLLAMQAQFRAGLRGAAEAQVGDFVDALKQRVEADRKSTL